MGDKLRNRASLAKRSVVITVEHLEEGPLSPFVIIRITGANLAVPIVRETNLVKLAAVTGDVVFCCYLRMLSGLDGILLCRKAECIITHGVKHVEALQPLVTGNYIAGNISKRMSYMKTCS